MRARAAWAAVLVAALAGCSEAPKADTPGLGTDPDCKVDCVLPPIDGNSSVAAPAWVVGQWWEWEVTFPGQDPTTFTTMVVSTDGSTRLVATDNADVAKEEAAFDVLLLGEIGDTLKMTRRGADWDLLSFPLNDGKTWKATVPNIAWDVLPADTVSLDMRATFDADADGYRVMGHAGDAMVLEFTYVPATGWFSEFIVYDIDEGDDPEEFRMRAVDSGLKYTGTYYVDTATSVADMYDASGLDNPPPEGEPVLNVDPHVTFTLGTDATSLYGFVEIFVAVGDREVAIMPPDNGDPYHFQLQGGPDGAEGSWPLDLPAEAGEWRVVTTGAGGYSGAFVQLFSIVETAATM